MSTTWRDKRACSPHENQPNHNKIYHIFTYSFTIVKNSHLTLFILIFFIYFKPETNSHWSQPDKKRIKKKAFIVKKHDPLSYVPLRNGIITIMSWDIRSNDFFHPVIAARKRNTHKKHSYTKIFFFINLNSQAFLN